MYRVTLINSQTNEPHYIAGQPVVVETTELTYTVEQVMRNRDPKLFRIIVERANYDSN